MAAMSKSTKKNKKTSRPSWELSFFKNWNAYPPKDVPFWLAHFAGMIGDVSDSAKERNKLLAGWDEILEMYRENKKENPHYDVADFLYEEHDLDIEKDLEWFHLHIDPAEELVCFYLGSGTCLVLEPGCWEYYFAEFPQAGDEDEDEAEELDEDFEFHGMTLSERDKAAWREFKERTDAYEKEKKNNMATNNPSVSTLTPELETFRAFVNSQMTKAVQADVEKYAGLLHSTSSAAAKPVAYWTRVKEAYDTALTSLMARKDKEEWTISVGFDSNQQEISSSQLYQQGLFVEVSHKTQSLRERRTLRAYTTIEVAIKDGKEVSRIQRNQTYSTSSSYSSSSTTSYGYGSYGKSKKFTYSDVEALRKKPYIPDPAKVQKMPKKLFDRTIVVGDLHGCADELLKLLDLVKFNPSKDRLISVGDIVDRGPKIHECFEIFREYKGYAVLGNHEEPFLKWRMYEKQEEWEGSNNPIDLTKRDDQKGTMKVLTEADWQWMETMPLFFRLPEFKHNPLVVHAGLFPGRFNRPETMDPFGIIRMIRIDPKKNETLPFSAVSGEDWWEEYDRRPGPHHVIYGHSTTKEVRRKAHSTGLDTGGVYGGKLSALILPTWEVVSVDCTAHHVSSAAELSGAQSFVIGGPEKKAGSSSTTKTQTASYLSGDTQGTGSTGTDTKTEVKGFLPSPKGSTPLSSKTGGDKSGTYSSDWYDLDFDRKDTYDIDGVWLEAFNQHEEHQNN